MGADRAGELVARLERVAERCPTCRAVLEPYPFHRIALRAGEPMGWALLREAPPAPPLSEQVAAARSLVEEVEGQPTLERTLGLLLLSPRFQTCGVATYLLENAERYLASGQPEAGRHALTVAGLVLDRVEPDRCAAGEVEDLRAFGHALRAEAALVRDDLEGAEEASAEAGRHGLRGSGAWPVWGRLELVRCRVLLAVGRAEEARAAARSLIDAAGWEGEGAFVLEATEVVARSAVAAGDLEGGLDWLGKLERGLRVLGGGAPRHRGTLALERGRACTALGRHGEALEALAGAEEALEEVDDPRAAARRSWWTGVALRGLGRVAEAEEALEAAWRGLLGAGAPLDAARAALDLAGFLAEQAAGGPPTGRLVELAEGLCSLLEDPALPRRAASVLLRFQGWIRTAAARGDPGPAPDRIAGLRSALEGARRPSPSHSSFRTSTGSTLDARAAGR